MLQQILNNNGDQKTLIAVFPFRILRSDELILDPHNTEYTAQYYLLENLSTGLLRDDPLDIRNYRPALALGWEQINPTTWVFQMKSDLQWSNGSPITGTQLIENFKRLKHVSSRHIVYLKKLKNIEFNETTKKLTFTFNQPTNESLLHELSLADAVLLHPTNLTINWEITSGPYSVEEYKPSEKILVLHLNKNSPIVRKTSPKIVRLIGLKNLKECEEIFKRIDVDLIEMLAPSFQPINRTIEKNAPRVVKGFPTAIYYFVFDPKHPLSKNIQARREFSYLVQKAFEKEQIDQNIRYENQFVPLGFSGRLSNYERNSLNIQVLKNTTLLINWHPAFQDSSIPLNRLQEVAEVNDVTIKFDYTAYTEEEKKQHGYFAKFREFVGNQRDALGSFSFLFSGDLEPFKNEVTAFFDYLTASRTEEDKESTIQQLHKKILDDAYAVPFMIESVSYATSNRIDLSRWNSFDMRMRLYDIRWR